MEHNKTHSCRGLQSRIYKIKIGLALSSGSDCICDGQNTKMINELINAINMSLALCYKHYS